jgi:hypothetical protein
MGGTGDYIEWDKACFQPYSEITLSLTIYYDIGCRFLDDIYCLKEVSFDFVWWYFILHGYLTVFKCFS